jgi:hypothetical protein
MNRLLNLILASSTMLMAFLDKTPAKAKDCPQLNRNIITVLSDNAMLRVYPDDRASKGPPLFKGQKLRINHNRGATIVNQRCFYPVMINNSTYWIPDNKIKEYNTSYDISDNKSLVKQVQISTKQRGIFSWHFLPFIALFTLILIASVLALAYRQVKKKTLFNRLYNEINQLNEDNIKISMTLHKVSEILSENNILLHKIQVLLQQKTVISNDIRQSSTTKTDNLYVSSITEKPIVPILSPSCDLILPTNPSISSSLEEKNILDPFYGIVIDKFNNADHAWFRSRIQDGIFRNATITKSSIIETINPIKVELSTNGTLLLYHAADKICLIPDLTQPSWTRTITSSLFINTGEILNLKRAVELTSDTKNSWLLVKRGEFQG